jgi:MFS family permease
MLQRSAATDSSTAGWGSTALRRATLTLAISQLVSCGVLFYGFAVTSSAIRDDTGWSEGLVSGAFALGLLIAGLDAPPVARALAGHDPRLILTAGSLLGIVGMLGFAAAPTLIVLYLAWVVIGAAMAATLYEPVMAVLVALDPARRYRTLTVVTVAGGLASTVFAPVGACSSTRSAGAKRSPCWASAADCSRRCCMPSCCRHRMPTHRSRGYRISQLRRSTGAFADSVTP